MGHLPKHFLNSSVTALLLCCASLPVFAADKIVHDAEHYILLSQHGEKWQTEDKDIDSKLEELQKKFGKRPNIVHILFDDTSTGEVGSALANKIRSGQQHSRLPRRTKWIKNGIRRPG